MNPTGLGILLGVEWERTNTGMPMLISCRTLMSFVNSMEAHFRPAVTMTESTRPKTKPNCSTREAVAVAFL